MKFAKLLMAVLIAAICPISKADDKNTPDISSSYAWEVIQPLGLREPASIDTLFSNYSLQFVPSNVSPAWATTGNYGAPGINMIYFDRKPMTDFFFSDGLQHWLPSPEKIKFYNTKIPITLLSYNFGGDKNNGQDRLQATFSGNVNKQLQFGAIADYLYSKGSYDFQAVKNFTWGFNGSYIGDHIEVQLYQYHYNLTNQENGGITDDLYITDPAEIQGGNSTVNPKTIPTNLNRSKNRSKGSNIFLNARYKLGFWKEIEQEEDSASIEEFIPVTAFTWTFNWNEKKHLFTNTNSEQDAEFWNHRYLSTEGTHDLTKYTSVRNTLGVSLLEGFNKYAKFGLSAYASLDLRSYTQAVDSMLYLPDDERPRALDIYEGELPLSHKKEAQLSVGAQLTKQQGSILKYEALAELGITGRTAGDLKIEGNISTTFPLFRDSVALKAYGNFYNETPSYFVENFISNHFIWLNDFGKTRRARIGGDLWLPFVRNSFTSDTHVNIGVENLQNLIYFDTSCTPQQYGSNIQILSFSLQQNFTFRALHWDNRLILQTNTGNDILPLPKFAVYSNLYVNFKVARVLDVQFGVDCDYYTKYKALNYQPATMTFYNDEAQKCGGFPFMNVYANMKLGRTRFYVMFSHVNQGIIGKPDYFSLPHYPLNPRRFQLGLSIEFVN